MSLEGRADLNTCFWLQCFVFYHTDNTGMCATQGCTAGGCCSTLHLLSFKEKLLARQRGNVEKRVMQGFACPSSPLPGYRRSGQEQCL